VAVDYPGFGLSSARPGYTFKPREHSDVLERVEIENEKAAISIAFVMAVTGMIIGSAFTLPELGEIAV
jgi:hypothetical protein